MNLVLERHWKSCLSNTYDLNILRTVYDSAVVKPSILQNRFYPESGHDVEIRAFCDTHDIAYQSFWTLTGNPKIVNSKLTSSLASKYSATNQQIVFAFVQAMGITPLSGTTSPTHMTEDLAVSTSIKLNEEEVGRLKGLLR
eukprot:gene26500-33086_t